MKKLLQLSFIALAGQLVFSCSPTKNHYQFAAKDSAYGYKAPQKEVKATVEEINEEATHEEIILEASAPNQLAEPDLASTSSPALLAAATLTKKSVIAASTPATAVTENAVPATKTDLTQQDKKDLKKKIKEIKKTTRLDGNLRMALILALVAIIASALTGVAGLGTLMGIVAGVAGLGALIFFVLWLVDQV
jgi:hypothetical protein